MNILFFTIGISGTLAIIISIILVALGLQYSPKFKYLCCNRCLGYAPAVKINTPEVETTTKSTLISLLL